MLSAVKAIKRNVQSFVLFIIMALLLAFLSFVFLILLYILKPRIKKAIKAKLPPIPPKLPIIGNSHQVGKIPHQSLWQLSQKYGPIMLLQLGKTPTLVISSADMAKEILQTHDIDFCSRPPSSAPKRLFYNFSDVAFSPYTDHCRERRKDFASYLLNSKRAWLFSEAREFEVNHLIEFILQASPNPINLEELLFNLMDGAITAAAFGKSYRGKQFEGQDLKEVLHEAMVVIDFFSAENFFPSMFGKIIVKLTGHSRRMNKCFGKLDCYLQHELDEHLDPNRPKDCYEYFVDVLIGFSKGQSVLHLNNNYIKALLMNTFLGGVNGTALAMVWAMLELVKNPRVMQKVQTEIRSCIEGKLKVEADDLENLNYLKIAVKETIRMHPTAPLLIPHQSMQYCRIGGDDGCDIFPETRVLVNVWGIGQDPKSWKNPKEFYPEKFEENDSVDYKGKHFELLPFGAGRRLCPAIGLSFAKLNSQ